MEKEERKPFNKRAFISIAMFVSALGLPLSGIMNHDYQFAEMIPERHFWMSVHNTSALIFSIFVIVHLYYNWKPLIKYVNKAKNTIISKEAIWALVFVVFIVGVFSSHVFHVR